MDLLSWTFESQIDDKDKPLLIDASNDSRSLSYSSLLSHVRRLVAGLHAVGVRDGDCVLVNSFNDLFYSVLYLGIIGSGAIYSGANPANTVHELTHQLRITKPKLLIIEPELLHTARTSANEVGLPESCIYSFDAASEISPATSRSWKELLCHGERAWRIPKDPRTTIAHYASTSGTSGLPKAAMIPHAYHVSQATARLASHRLPYEPVRLCALPPMHVFATPIIPSAIRQGITTYVMRRFAIEPFVQAIERFGITETYLPPPCVSALPRSPHATQSALSSLRQIWWGGASLKFQNQLPLYALLHHDAIIQPVWGMTEAGWITSGNWPEKMQDDSVGSALPGFRVKIVDDGGDNIHREGATGNIVVKSPCMMLGYLGNEEATRDAFDDEGWLRTGDIGQLVDGNKVFVVDRKKDLMKVRGWQVSPAEVENTILQHPAVKDAAVIGIESSSKPTPHGSVCPGGEVPRAYVVLQDNCNVEVPDLKAFIARSLARYKIPEEFVFTDTIPKNSTGKILRRVLRGEAAKEAKTSKLGVHPEAAPAAKPQEGGHSQEGATKKPWYRMRRLSNGSIRTVSAAKRSICRFFIWLRDLLVL